MGDELGEQYKVLLPQWVFKRASTSLEVEEKAAYYVKQSFPDRYLIRVEGKFALCELRQNSKK